MSPRTRSRRWGSSRRYEPRNGTIRGSAAAPASTASRSDHRPAQNTAKRATTSPRECRRRIRRDASAFEAPDDEATLEAPLEPPVDAALEGPLDAVLSGAPV